MATVPRSLAELSLSFGLVNVPVQLYSATDESEKITFNWIHRDCGSRVEMRWFCKKEDIEVKRLDLIKGREVAKGEYVLFTPDELKMLEERGTGTVDIVGFLPANAIDPVYYSKAYYLLPAKHGARPYRLLVEGMQKTGRTAIARWAFHGKTYTAQVRPGPNGVLVLQQLYYADEVRTMHVEHADMKPSELDLAVKLIEQTATDEFHPEEFRNEFQDRIEAAIQAKIEGKEIVVPEEEPQHSAQLIDLAEVLRKSLQAVPGTAKRKPVKRATPKKTAVKQPVPKRTSKK
jgi:DNA end-binding protein Ku